MKSRKILFVAAMVLLLLGLVPELWKAWNYRQFDGLNWKKGSSAGKGRAAMLSDLLSNHIEPGMKRHEIISILGEPNAEMPVRSGDPHDLAATYDQYYTDGPVLLLYYSRGGTLVKPRVVNDRD